MSQRILTAAQQQVSRSDYTPEHLTDFSLLFTNLLIRGYSVGEKILVAEEVFFSFIVQSFTELATDMGFVCTIVDCCEDSDIYIFADYAKFFNIFCMQVILVCYSMQSLSGVRTLRT